MKTMKTKRYSPSNSPLTRGDDEINKIYRPVLQNILLSQKRHLDEVLNDHIVSPPTKLSRSGPNIKQPRSFMDISGYNYYHNRSADKLCAAKRVADAFFGPPTSDTAKDAEMPQPQWPSCSMPSASTSGYTTYNNRSADDAASAAKSSVLGSFGPMPNTISAEKTKSEGSLEELNKWPSCSMPSASTSGYSAYNNRSAQDVASAAKSSVLLCFGPMPMQEDTAKKPQPQWPSCSMPSASTSGYTSYNNRSADDVASAAKSSVLGSFGPMPNTISAEKTKSEGNLEELNKWPSCSMLSASTSGYSAYNNRSTSTSASAFGW